MRLEYTKKRELKIFDENLEQSILKAATEI
jgi:hypothetical protein